MQIKKKGRTSAQNLTAAFFAVVGRSLIVAGRFVGSQAAKLYRSIDPDVARHLIQTPLLSYSLFSSRKVVVGPQRPDGHPPLVFVHGLGGSRGDFLLMAAYFWLKGRRRAYRIYFQKGQSIDQMANALARFIRQVKKVTKEKKVDLVAHSLGGVIARIAVMDRRLGDSVKTLVTLGAPHQGTYAARFFNTINLRDLRPESALISRLRRKKWPRNVRGISFWSRNDLMVLPSESAMVPGMSAVEMTPFTHYNYLIDPQCWHAVFQSLQGSGALKI